MGRNGALIVGGAVLLLLLGMVPQSQADDRPLVMVDGQTVELTVAPLSIGDDVFVWVRDLERIGLGQVSWDVEKKQATLTSWGLRRTFTEGDRRVTVPLGTGRGFQVAEWTMPHAPLRREGCLMVPLGFICELMGLGHSLEERPVMSLTLPEALASRDHPAAEDSGAINGRVLWGQAAAGGIMLRLVRTADFTFVPDQRAITDEQGRYSFLGVTPGDYSVFAYVGDNPEYFNRYTAPIRVDSAAAQAPDLHLGRILGAASPAPGCTLPPGEVILTWTECRPACAYAISVVDCATEEEVFSQQIALQPGGPGMPVRAVVPGERLQGGHSYEWSVIATDSTGEYVGGSPGSGLPRWSFKMAD